MLDTISAMLVERNVTHGDYCDHAGITQAIKAVLYNSVSRRYPDRPLMHKLSDMQRESLDMIAHKIGRILAGDPNHKDHWDDIAGYSKLIADAIGREP
jgi:hypothetical protein